MLKIIDRYIIKKFLSTFFFMLGIIMLLAMVFDVSEKLSEFISNKAPMSEIIFDYYVNFILFYGNTFSSMIIFISVIWFTAKMAQDTEIIPIWFSGRPITRFLRPYMIGATILMIFSFVLNHFIVPRSSKVRLAFEEKYYRDVLSVEDYQKGNFFNYTLETEEEFNPEMLVGVLVELLDGCSELITDIKYKDHEMVKDYGDTRSKGFTYMLN